MNSTNPSYSSVGEMHSHGNDGIVVLIIFFAVCCCSVGIYFLCKDHNQEEFPQQQSPDTTEARRQRIDLIREALIVKPWTGEPMSATVAIDETATTEKTRDDELPKALPTPELKSQHSSITSLYGPCCAICLNGFKEGQLVCESKNGSCEHSFHEMCLIQWLVLKGHNDCPICRAKYMVETA
jgi:hypothetical protein